MMTENAAKVNFKSETEMNPFLQIDGGKDL